MSHDQPPEPWHSFLIEIDRMLNRPVVLHCIGGFAIAMLYGMPRPTVDVDCVVTPVEETAALQSLAGEASTLHKKHGVYLQHVGVVSVPENYTDRLLPMFPTAFHRLVLLGLEAHDLALSNSSAILPATVRMSDSCPARQASMLLCWRTAIGRNCDRTLRTPSGTI